MQTHYVIACDERQLLQTSAALRAARPAATRTPPSHEAAPPSLARSLAPLPPSALITTFPTSSFPPSDPLPPRCLDKTYLFKKAHAETLRINDSSPSGTALLLLLLPPNGNKREPDVEGLCVCVMCRSNHQPADQPGAPIH